MFPCLFAIFIDDIVTKLKSLGLGCNTVLTCTSIFLYGDDIMVISPSVSILQTMLHLCESELLDLDMSLNVKKSVCMRFGPRFDATYLRQLNNTWRRHACMGWHLSLSRRLLFEC